MAHSIVILNMNGNEEMENINSINQLAYVCGYTDNMEEFKKVHTWAIHSEDEEEQDISQLYLHVYACSKGSYEVVNKSELPPPLDTTNYYGYIALVLEDKNHELCDLSIDEWKQYYEQLYGGFEDIEETDDESEDDESEDDESEEDETENGSKEDVIITTKRREKRYTKDGYEIDDFVVSDNDEIEYETDDDNEKN